MQYDYKPALTPDVCQDGNLLNQSTVFARSSTQQFQFLKTQSGMLERFYIPFFNLAILKLFLS